MAAAGPPRPVWRTNFVSGWAKDRTISSVPSDEPPSTTTCSTRTSPPSRWAVTEGTAAERGAALWLADRCEGKTLADLPDLAEYSSEADLLSAAAAGEVDLFALDTAQSAQVAAVLPEAAVLGETERLYDGAVLAGTVDVRLTEALAGAVNALLEEDGEDGQLLRAVLDAEADTHYRTAPAGALDAQRHLAALG